MTLVFVMSNVVVSTQQAIHLYLYSNATWPLQKMHCHNKLFTLPAFM